MLKRISIFILILLTSHPIYADKVSISISAPKVVQEDEPFRIIYEIGSSDVTDFENPDFSGFHLIDRYQSSSSSTTIINGQVSTKTSTTITLILSSNKSGHYTIGPARIHINGETYSTKTIPIEVYGGSAGSSSQNNSSSGSRPSAPSTPQPPSNVVSSSDIFVRLTASKTSAYEQEPILLTYKVYASPQMFVTGFQGKLPTLNGFHIQELDPPSGQESETYMGKNYNTAIWRQYLVYPQSSGAITIPAIECEATINRQNGYMDPFGMFPRNESFTKNLTTNSLTLNVKPLPETPVDFYGGVGDFNISSSLNKKKLKSSDILTLKINITGTGNLKLIETPTVEFPSVFETYDCKVTDDYTLTRSGHEGSKIFEYRAVPQKGGKYTIPPVRFTYFDPSTEQYKTLSTPSYHIDVLSDPNQPSQIEVDELDKDIKHIKLGDVDIRKNNYSNLYSWKWIMAYILVILAFAVTYGTILHRKGILFKTSSSKRRQANKLITDQLEKSRRLKDSGDTQGFYVELLNALYSFPQNRLNMSKEEFNKDNLKNSLESHHVPMPVIEEYLRLMEECELTRYFRAQSTSDLESDYQKAIEIIKKLDSYLK